MSREAIESNVLDRQFQAMLLRADILVAESRQWQAMLHTDAISCKQYFVGQTVASNVLQCRLL